MLYSSLFHQFSKWVAPYVPKVSTQFLPSIIMTSWISTTSDKFQCTSVTIPTDAQVPSSASGSLFQLPPESFWHNQSNISKLPCFLVWQDTPDSFCTFPAPERESAFLSRSPASLQESCLFLKTGSLLTNVHFQCKSGNCHIIYNPTNTAILSEKQRYCVTA